jgi:hypothetical protein
MLICSETARQTLVSAATNINKDIPVTIQQNRGIVRHGDFYPGCVEVMKCSSFVNSKRVETSPRFREH